MPDSIPRFSLPLRPDDQEPLVDLQTLLNDVYDRCGYDYFIDYRLDPLPPMSKADMAWLDALLRSKDLR